MNKLQKFLASATPDEREAVAEHAGTTVDYLRQLAGGHRRAGLSIAVAIESATAHLYRITSGRCAAVTCQDLDEIPEKS